MRRVFGGAVLVVAGIAAFIEAHSHMPVPAEAVVEGNVYQAPGPAGSASHSLASTGLSQTAYDLLRIGAWALVILGGLLVVVGLIGYWASKREPAAKT